MATWVLVYALWAVARDRPPERHLVHRRRIYLDDRDTGRWHHFSFLGQVRRWITNPHGNQGLFVQATDSRGEPLAVIQPLSDEEKPYVTEPLFSLLTLSVNIPRSRKSRRGVVGWRISDVAVMRHVKLVDSSPSGTMALDHASSRTS